MPTFRLKLRRVSLIAAAAAILALSASAQGVKRVVIVKVDGLPNYYVDRMARERDPVTGRSRLPWIDEVFYKNGSRMVNFYTRGMSLSAPSWAQLDTGQHMQIKGNVEFDRSVLHSFDYLNFFPFYMNYGLSRRVDMPAVEVLDQLGIPLLSDAFPVENKYTSPQLCQRGNDWGTIAGGFVNMLPRTREDAIDEWTLGFPVRSMISDQNVRDIAGKLVKRPEIDYFDFYTVAFDHASHHFNDPAIRDRVLKEADGAIGTIWTAMQKSSRADETALVLVSDHGFNSEEGTISQGFNIVKLLAAREGGGHHVITKRRLMMDYSIKGAYPLVPLITTTSHDSFYLNGQSGKYPTALVDFDGNERSSIHLRENDLNVLHILFQQLKAGKLSTEITEAATNEVFRIVDKHRPGWQQTATELDEELAALHRWIEAKQKLLPGLMMKPKGKVPGEARIAENNRRLAAQVDIAVRQETDHKKYLQTLKALAALNPETFDAKKLDIERHIAPGAMGEPNTTYDLQNYVVGLSDDGLKVNEAGQFDLDKSFTRVNYFELLHGQTVRNNVQENVGNRPIDFLATRIPLERFGDTFINGLAGTLPNRAAIWLYGTEDKQALILTRIGADGAQNYQYRPIARLRQDALGTIRYEVPEWGPGFPLKIYEDPALAVPGGERRESWLQWSHSEVEWLNATHKTQYSNAIIGLNEQMLRHPLGEYMNKLSDDERLIHRFRQRQRRLVEADLFIHASNHWNFDVRGFNPGGNHGSFFRVSTNSTFMIAGGQNTGVPRGLAIDAPYDGMSFMPTILRLMGKIDEENRPVPEMYERGYRRFPGRVVSEIVGKKK
jgi:hypothetical protein